MYAHGAMASASGDGQGPSQAVPARRRPVSESANPTVRQRELGMRLRELRTGLGLTVEEVPVLFPLLGLEQEAVVITSFSMYYVPALLQTGDYARVITKGIEPKMDPEVLEQRVEARMKRQQLLDRPTPPRYRALLDEAVLHGQVGGSAVMRAQPGKILECAAEEKAAVQVIPFDGGAHASTDSNFTFLEFGETCSSGPLSLSRASLPTATKNARSRSSGTARQLNTCAMPP